MRLDTLASGCPILAVALLANPLSSPARAADGALDPAFSANGLTTVDFALGTNKNDHAQVAVVQSDGKLLVAGTSEYTSIDSDFTVARLLMNGSLDTTFSGDGLAAVAFDLSSPNYMRDSLRSIALDRDGKILLCGVARDAASHSRIAVARLLPNGSLDASFSGDGKPVVFLDNRVQGGHDSYVTRLSGELVDPTFGAAGWQHLATLAGGDWDWTDFALGPDDKILLTGAEYLGLQQSVARLLANGSALDNSFDSDGRLTFEFIPGIQAGYAAGMAIGGGRPHAVGTVLNQTDDDFGIARLTTSAVFTDGFEYGSSWFWSGTSTP